MTPANVKHILFCLVGQTFREAIAARTFWLLLVVAAIPIVLCASVRMENTGPLTAPDDNELADERGNMTIGFGTHRVQLFRDGAAAVQMLQIILAKWGTGSVGLLLAVVWTAGFLPTFLDPANAVVMFAKAPPRTLLFCGKFVGVVAFVAFQAALFVFGTWLALFGATGQASAAYLWSWPVLMVQFVAIFSVSALLAAWTRSSVIATFGSLAFWGLCIAINFAHHSATALPKLDPTAEPPAAASQAILAAGYWVLPKPLDLMHLLDQILGTGKHFTLLPQMTVVDAVGSFHPIAAALTTLASAVLFLAMAAYQAKKIEY